MNSWDRFAARRTVRSTAGAVTAEDVTVVPRVWWGQWWQGDRCVWGQRRYPIGLRDRATRMTVEALADPARSKGAIRRIAGGLGIHPEALRTRVRQAEVDQGARPGTTTGDAERIEGLALEARESRRANAIWSDMVGVM